MNFAQNDVSRPPRRKGHETVKRLEKTPGKVSAYTGTNPKFRSTPRPKPRHTSQIPDSTTRNVGIQYPLPKTCKSVT